MYVYPVNFRFFSIASKTPHFLPGGSVLHGDHAGMLHLAAPTPVCPPRAFKVYLILPPARSTFETIENSKSKKLLEGMSDVNALAVGM